MTALVTTNNPLVREAHGENAADVFSRVEICYVDGDVESLLLKIRDMVYEGYPLLSHPLPSSMRMIHSKYRSVLLGTRRGELDPLHAEIAEDSLGKYRRAAGHRIPENANDDEYKWLDMQLLSATLKEPRPFSL